MLRSRAGVCVAYLGAVVKGAGLGPQPANTNISAILDMMRCVFMTCVNFVPCVSAEAANGGFPVRKGYQNSYYSGRPRLRGPPYSQASGSRPLQLSQSESGVRA